jgi:hypothetical protein
MFKKFLLLIILSIFILTITNSQSSIVSCQDPNNCKLEDLSQTIKNLIAFIVKFAYWFTFIVVGIGGFLIMFGGPYPELIKKGHSIIWIAIWGYILILASGVIFDAILDFFQPKFKTYQFKPKIYVIKPLYAAIEPETFYKTPREALQSSLKCGLQNQLNVSENKAINQIVTCLFVDIRKLLTNAVLFLLTLAIISSAIYLITTPLFGFKQISNAYQILIWSIIGFIIVLIADIIGNQIVKILKVD